MTDHNRRVDTLGVDLCFYKSLQLWSPQVGDVVVYHGWVFSQWFGVVSNINPNDSCDIITGGLPVLMLTQGGQKMKKNTKTIDLHDIRTASQGTYAVIKNELGRMVWYV